MNDEKREIDWQQVAEFFNKVLEQTETELVVTVKCHEIGKQMTVAIPQPAVKNFLAHLPTWEALVEDAQPNSPLFERTDIPSPEWV